MYASYDPYGPAGAISEKAIVKADFCRARRVEHSGQTLRLHESLKTILRGISERASSVQQGETTLYSELLQCVRRMEKGFWRKILALFHREISQLFLTRTLRFGKKGNDRTFLLPLRQSTINTSQNKISEIFSV